tara:strand:+ start:1472 stop:2029 length:558 start_codon:yes stop_codon:yes gene_type:complete
VIKLTAKMPFQNLLPLRIGTITLSDETPAFMTLIDYPDGSEAGVSEALKKAHRIPLAALNRTTRHAENRCIWFGKNHLLLGPEPDEALAKIARLTDVSDGYVVLRAEGKDIEVALARLVPIDLALSHFKIGHTARTLVHNMHAAVIRVSNCAFQIIVFRSMAQTLMHDLMRAMRSVDARASLLKR